MKPEDIKILSATFPDDIIGVKINNLSKDKTKAMLILYLQHTDVYARIEQVDPSWSVEVMRVEIYERIHFGKPLKTINVSMKMTIKGVSRENVGEGDDFKSAYSDSIKRVAMLFGVGRYLYDAQQVWVPYNEQTDKYKKWSISDYKKLAPEIKHQEGPSTYEATIIPEDDFNDLLKSPPAKGSKENKIVDFGKVHIGKTFGQMITHHTDYLNYMNKPDAKGTLKELLEYAREQGVLK